MIGTWSTLSAPLDDAGESRIAILRLLPGIYGSGNPTFGAPISTGVTPEGYKRMAVADFDGNGLADFLYTHNGALRLRPLVKSGSTYVFGAVQNYALGCTPWTRNSYFPPTVSTDAMRPMVADFNGDGIADLLLRVIETPWCDG